jgi:hypothetical protein
MESAPAHELGAILLSTSFLVALIVGGIAGWLGGMMIGAGPGALAVSAMSLAAAWITWQGGDQPERGMTRVEGTVAIEAEAENWTRSGDPLTNHDLVIQYIDERGNQHRIAGEYAPHKLAPGQTVKIDYPPGNPDRAAVADPGRHRTLLIVFLLFGCVPLAMSSVMFASAWEQRREWKPAPRSPGVRTACAWGRAAATLIFLSGFGVTFWYTDIRSFAFGFPLVGAGALAHALIGAVAGMRPSMVLTAVVVGVGFVGFGLMAGASIDG